MAVWLYVYGKNGLLTDINSPTNYLDILNKIHTEEIKILDSVIESKRLIPSTEEHFNFAYQQFKNGQVKSRWELEDDGCLVNKLLFFDIYDGLRLNIVNDLIRITGPFSVFSVYGFFQNTISDASREYYHSYFKKILKAFQSDFILYAHEWSGLADEEDSEFNFTKLKQQANWELTGSSSIHNMDRFYYEQL